MSRGSYHPSLTKRETMWAGFCHQATHINPKDSQMSVDAEQDAPDMALRVPVRGPGGSQEPETWHELSSKDR